MIEHVGKEYQELPHDHDKLLCEVRERRRHEENKCNMFSGVVDSAVQRL